MGGFKICAGAFDSERSGALDSCLRAQGSKDREVVQINVAQFRAAQRHLHRKMFELHLLDECATSSEVVELEAPDPEPAPQNKVEILASLPPDFDRKAQEKYEKLFAIRAC